MSGSLNTPRRTHGDGMIPTGHSTTVPQAVGPGDSQAACATVGRPLNEEGPGKRQLPGAEPVTPEREDQTMHDPTPDPVVEATARTEAALRLLSHAGDSVDYKAAARDLLVQAADWLGGDAA